MRRWLRRGFSELAKQEASPQPTPLELDRALNRLFRAEHFEHEVTEMTDIMTKRINTELFDDRLLPKQRVVLEPVRMRDPLDTFDHLRTTGHLPAAIAPRGDQPGVDFVLHKSQARALRHLQWSHHRPIYVRLPGGAEARCLLRRLFVTPDHQHYLKATFDRYVVGEPNVIRVKLAIGRGVHLAGRNAQPELLYEDIELVSYNEVNPIELEIDYNRLSRKKRYTLGDLVNTLPPGLAPHPKHKSLDFLLAKMLYAPTRVESDMEHLAEGASGVLEPEAAAAAEAGSLTSIESEAQWDRARAQTTELRREERRARLDEAKLAHPGRFKEFVPFKKRVEADATAFRKKLEEETRRLDEEVAEKRRQQEEERLKVNKRLLKKDEKKEDG